MHCGKLEPNHPHILSRLASILKQICALYVKSCGRDVCVGSCAPVLVCDEPPVVALTSEWSAGDFLLRPPVLLLVGGNRSSQQGLGLVGRQMELTVLRCAPRAKLAHEDTRLLRAHS